MPQNSYDVFISYRRANGAAEARLIRSALVDHGLRVFLDVTDLDKGLFDDALLRCIAVTPNFVVILSPHALDSCVEKGDWLRAEIAHAAAHQRNIVPVMLPGFEFPAQLPDDITTLPRHQAVQYSHVFFEAAVSKILQMVGGPAHGSRMRRVAQGLGIGANWFSFKLLISLALAMAAVMATGYYVHSRSPQVRLQQSVKDLRDQFREAVEALPRSGPGGFTEVDKDVGVILELDPKNGHGLYFSGEAKRIKNQSLFTSKSCVIPEGLADNRGALDAYESDFYRYLDIEKSLPESETGGDYSAETCYARASGYCPQRTAWINHLLANDLYREAALSTDPAIKAEQLRRALSFAETAAQLYRDGQQPGFEQCTPTVALIDAVKQEVASIPK